MPSGRARVNPNEGRHGARQAAAAAGGAGLERRLGLRRARQQQQPKARGRGADRAADVVAEEIQQRHADRAAAPRVRDIPVPSLPLLPFFSRLKSSAKKAHE